MDGFPIGTVRGALPDRIMTTDRHTNLQQNPMSAAWKRAEAYGMDVSLMKANLRLSVAERLLRHDAALRLMQSLREAVKRKNAAHG
ncbi:MAG: hypothetical protein PHI39_00725 [Kiritimatiellae bacterium]|jgi:hypothetical protein|nr:hypothetical protein [Kiritimatiellia bacterium]MDD4116720.1 hypothetical protein [Kiritimatiellia bacterium]